MTPRLRQLLRDPPPLPPDAPAFVDEQAEAEYAERRRRAMDTMRRFDQQKAAVRRVDWVTGNIAIASQLVDFGHDTPEKAEPIVRKLLEMNTRGRR